MVNLSCDLGFLKLKNPVLAASGTCGYGLELKPFCDLEKLGGLVVKGLYLEPKEGNYPPRIAETPAGMLNAIGLQGIGVKTFIEKILPDLQGLNTAVIVNVCGSYEEEYAAVAELLDRSEGIAAYELNISCPNVKKEGMCPSLSPESTYSVVKTVKSTCRRPVITKLSPNVTSISEIARAAEEAGSDGISLINTILAMAVDIESRRPKLGNVFGGLSGPAIKPIALRMVYQAAKAVKIPVIGMGGIMTGKDALEFLIAGASAVEVGTATLIDPDACLRIIDEMTAWCETHLVKNLKEIIGSLSA